MFLAPNVRGAAKSFFNEINAKYHPQICELLAKGKLVEALLVLGSLVSNNEYFCQLKVYEPNILSAMYSALLDYVKQVWKYRGKNLKDELRNYSLPFYPYQPEIVMFIPCSSITPPV